MAFFLVDMEFREKAKQLLTSREIFAIFFFLVFAMVPWVEVWINFFLRFPNAKFMFFLERWWTLWGMLGTQQCGWWMTKLELRYQKSCLNWQLCQLGHDGNENNWDCWRISDNWRFLDSQTTHCNPHDRRACMWAAATMCCMLWNFVHSGHNVPTNPPPNLFSCWSAVAVN